MEERVQKILARAGYGSRRASEELIIAGRVRINGQLAVLGSKADPQRDTITIDNQPIAREQAPVYIALNKPTGILSEVSPEEPRETVRDLVPVPGHMFIVGRLDLESEGLILLTNDGEMANKLTHPRYGHEKEYRVLVGARPDDRQLDAWRHGIVLEDGYRTAPAQVRLETLAGKGAWMRVILHEGRKRQIREMGKLTGLPVMRIQRIRIGSLLLGDLKPGQWRQLRPEEVRALKVNKPYRDAEWPARRENRREVPREGGARTNERARSSERTRSSDRSATNERTRSDERPRSSDRSRPSAERAYPADRSSRSERAERSGRGEHPRSERPQSSDRTQSTERSERSERTQRQDRRDSGGPFGSGKSRSEGTQKRSSEGPNREGETGQRRERPGGSRTSDRTGPSPYSGRKPAGTGAPRPTQRGPRKKPSQ